MNKPYRNKKIGEYIREEMVCCITGRTNPVNHHIIGHGYSGTGTKAPDFLQSALCHDLHTELHDKGWKSFEEKHGVTQKQLVAQTMWAVHSAGVINLNELDAPSWLFEGLEEVQWNL